MFAITNVMNSGRYDDRSCHPENLLRPKQTSNKRMPIGSMTLTGVDSSLADCEKTIKAHSNRVKVKLINITSSQSNMLRKLSRAKAHKGRLMIRRIEGPAMPPSWTCWTS
jgi:hypothetical protein